ncbi:WXG100 family type VII secretion target [Kutzneria sp. CA-103260]|uniref:WXG100 family type VII secretion target n=1 Tax=Kutzneria sp. CA-103260 TaxID=2802641 RepID=UPI001BA4838B|nr:hypothetical protein [Kutzneria sp. CA-103260]QUQ69774.1 hypothetical protein JJ691_75360 [Kutzneria sp. CA-103260]
MKKANIHPDHLRKSGGNLKKFGGTIQQTGETLETTGQNLVSHASGDRSGVGAVVAKFAGRATEIAGKTFKEGGRVAGSAGDRLGKTADLYEEADTTAATNLRKHHSGTKSKTSPPGGSARSGASVGKVGTGSGAKPKRVPGGGTGSAEKVGSASGGKDHKAPILPGGGSARRKGDLRDPVSATDQLPQLLKKHNMTREEFDSLRHRMNQPGGTANVTHEEAMKWRALREQMPLENGTPIQKVLQPHVVDKYLQGVVEDKKFDYRRSGGCFARSVDAEQMHTPGEKYNGLALNYPGTPFSPDMESVYVLRTAVVNKDNYDIPFGGTTQEGVDNIQGTRLWSEPFNGNGVTRSDDYLVPEWESSGEQLRSGSTIHRIDRDGTTHLVATFRGKRWV